MTAHAVANETFLDITITTFASAPSSFEPDSQRGRKRRRSPPGGSLEAPAARQQIPSGESAVFRGRCRYRSTSRLGLGDMASPRNASRVRGTSLSPTRKRFLQVLQLNSRRHRSQSPSRSRSAHHHYARAGPHPQDTPKRRRQRTRSRCRKHAEAAAAAGDFGAVVAEPLPILWHDYLEQQHDIVIRSEMSSPSD